MKKNFMLAVAAFGFSLSALAADNAGTPITVAITPDAAGCSLLTEEVTINLSAGVFGSYACNTDDNLIGVATCHPNGRKGNVVVSCSVAAGNGCVATPDASDAADNGTITVQGGVAFTASSGGGTVNGAAAQNCAAGGNVNAEAATAAQL